MDVVVLRAQLVDRLGQAALRPQLGEEPVLLGGCVRQEQLEQSGEVLGWIGATTHDRASQQARGVLDRLVFVAELAEQGELPAATVGAHDVVSRPIGQLELRSAPGSAARAIGPAVWGPNALTGRVGCDLAYPP